MKSSPHCRSWYNTTVKMGSWRRKMARPLSWSRRSFVPSPQRKGKCIRIPHLADPKPDALTAQHQQQLQRLTAAYVYIMLSIDIRSAADVAMLSIIQMYVCACTIHTRACVCACVCACMCACIFVCMRNMHIYLCFRSQFIWPISKYTFTRVFYNFAMKFATL